MLRSTVPPSAVRDGVGHELLPNCDKQEQAKARSRHAAPWSCEDGGSTTTRPGRKIISTSPAMRNPKSRFLFQPHIHFVYFSITNPGYCVAPNGTYFVNHLAQLRAACSPDAVHRSFSARTKKSENTKYGSSTDPQKGILPKPVSLPSPPVPASVALLFTPTPTHSTHPMFVCLFVWPPLFPRAHHFPVPDSFVLRVRLLHAAMPGLHVLSYAVDI